MSPDDSLKPFLVTQDSSPEVSSQDAERFLAALKEGLTPEAAAASVGKPLEFIKSTAAMREAVQAMVTNVGHFYLKDPERRKQVAIAKLIEQLLTAPEAKDQIAAARALPKVDPEAWPQQQAPLVNISISDDVRALDPGDLWEGDTK